MAIRFVQGLVDEYFVSDDPDLSCWRCGNDSFEIWMAPDDLWQLVSGMGARGRLCIACFDTLACERGIVLCWTPVIREPWRWQQPLPDWRVPVLSRPVGGHE
jgi:hypothetical protein